MSEIDNGNLAEIKDLSVSFMTDAGSIKAITGSVSRFPAGRSSAWWANPVPASP